MRYTREDGCRAWLTYGGLAPKAIEALLREYGSCERIYTRFRRAGSAMLEGCANPVQLKQLADRSEPETMHEMMLTMQKWEMGIVSYEDHGYPEALRTIDDAPFLLFYRGDLACLAGRCVTVIGSRRASNRGMEASRAIARRLSESGVRIISGLAMGIDTSAMLGGLEGGSPVVGVLGCGLDVDYPAANRLLKDKIIVGGGVLLSEYPPGIPALPHHFPVRNRIMSGLSSAVLMMEGKVRSGSMTTVQHALDQGREVYAYPGQSGTAWAEGAHQLLREGANYFASADDILEDLGWQRAGTVPAQPQQQELPALPPAQQQIYSLLQQGEHSFDQLAAETGLDAPTISGALTMLQIAGLIKALPGKVYKTANAV